MSKRQYGRQRGRQLSRLCHLLSVCSGFLGKCLPWLQDGRPSFTVRLCWGHTVNTKHSEAPADGKNSVTVTLPPRPESLRRWVQIHSSTPHLAEPQSVLLLTSHKDTHRTCPRTRPCSSTGLYPRSVLTGRRATTTPEQHPSLHGSHLSSLYVVQKPTPGNKSESTLKIPENSIPGWETAPSQHTPVAILGCLYKF